MTRLRSTKDTRSVTRLETTKKNEEKADVGKKTLFHERFHSGNRTTEI